MDRTLRQILNPETVSLDEMWRTYHENSKTERFHRPPSEAQVRARMAELKPSLDYSGYPKIVLPAPDPLAMPLGEAMLARKTCRDMEACTITLDQLSTLLFASYGETRSNVGTEFPRPFRTVPSGGALYPLEIYFHTARVEGLEAGLYHYNPQRHCVAELSRGDLSHRLSGALVQADMPLKSAIQVFVTGMFERSSFKYAERSYRFVLLEAGHLMQNLALAATALGLGQTCVGGYFDREIDDILGLDGVRRSTVYIGLLGRESARPLL
ncbi:SagB/ThcOx family dehydrogenase [Rhizobium sp. FY34]|uniref:SagB/ThcOx family dehydrogenase n=1 Tax=Rhizobium sp. FY34 TaxID=2562309 RepID=UPI0010C0548A|nr:SagB/ThcOx family dehydrogenase [Rhizobium sp. FY34]